MKKYIISLFCGLTLASCGDFLEVEPQEIITEDKFWNEEGDVQSVITSCYADMTGYEFISRMMIWGEFRSENIVMNGTHIEKDVNLERLLNEDITASNSYTTWTVFYSIINRCNVVIDRAPGVAENDPSYTQSRMRAHVAEATAIRSLCYFYLIRAFRNVPYSETPYVDDNQVVMTAATDFNTVLGNLISALENVKEDAVTKYPNTSSLGKYYNTARITKWAIYAMLSEMYLWKQDYDNCIRYADLVIKEKARQAEEEDASTDYSASNGFPLIPTKYYGTTNVYGYDFGQIFVRGNSQESIFEIFYNKSSGHNGTSNGPVSNFYGYYTTGAVPAVSWVNASTYLSNDVKLDKPKVFASKHDGRAYENFYYNVGGDPLYINKYTSSGVVELVGYTSTTTMYKNGYWSLPYDSYGNDHESLNKSNMIVYRLSDIMLLKAEALSLKLSDAQPLTEQDVQLQEQAFVLVNAVNKRSLFQQTPTDTLKMSDFASRSKMVDLVYAERERELMFEGKRYFDLVRRALRENDTKFLRESVSKKNAGNASVIATQYQKMDRIFWPYNLEETKVNPLLQQNPAFGSGENSSYDKTAD